MIILISKEKIALSHEIFNRLESVPLVDEYKAYQILNDEWVKIAVDLEMIQTEESCMRCWWHNKRLICIRAKIMDMFSSTEKASKIAVNAFPIMDICKITLKTSK